MAKHVLRFTTLFGSMLASATTLAAPKPFDPDLAKALANGDPLTLHRDEEVVMHSIVSCGTADRACVEEPLDLNGDGQVDLVVGVNEIGAGAPKRFYSGRSDGLFNPPQQFGIVTTTSGIKFADLNGDGRLDMVETVRGNGTPGSGTNSVYVNRNGTLASLFNDEQPLDSTKNDRSSSVAIGDVNGDGRPDIIIGNESTGGHDNAPAQTNYLYLNTTTPFPSTGSVRSVSFGPAIPLDVPGGYAYTRRVLLIDVEGDGDLDLVATSADTSADNAGNGNVLYINTGASPNPFAAAVPLNADPADDTDVANAIAAGDINGDNVPDLVFSTWSRMDGATAVQATNRYYINNSISGTIDFETTGVFGTSANHTNVRFGDVDGDGDGDLIALASNNVNRLYRKTSNSAPYFDAGVDFVEPAGLVPSPSHSRGLDLADLNGDGALDVVIANRGQLGLRYLNNNQCNGSACGSFSGPFANYTASITAQGTALIPPALVPFDVDTVLGAFSVTDPDNVYPSDFTAIVAQPGAGSRYICSDGVVSGGPTGGTCVNGRITPTGVFATIPIDLKVRDGQSSSSSFPAVLTVGTGNAPRFTTTTLPNATEDAPYATPIAVTDNDGDTLLTVSAVNPLPTWLELVNGELRSTTPPLQGDVGSREITLRVTDSTGLASPPQDFTLTVDNVNDKPAVSTTTLPNGTEGQTYANTTVTGTDEDPGTTLTFFATGLPNGMSIDSGTGVIGGTPTVSGAFQIALTASDGTLTSDPVMVSLTIAAANAPPPPPPPPPGNSPPTFTAPGPQSGTVGVAYTLSLAGSATDPNGDPLTFSATGLPPGITLSAAGLLSGSPTTATGSPFTATVTVSDGNGGQASGAFQFTVVVPTSGGSGGGGSSGGGGGSLGFLDLLSMLGLGALGIRRRRLATGLAPRR